jgi:trehalose 6-phosphate synthase/phosphatase
VIPILNEYVNRCNGTFVEEKTGSLAWHYRNADPDYAQLRLNELRYNLSEIIRNKTGFEIIEGNKVLEVKSGRYDKGFAAKSLIGQDHYDFVLAAGDDKTDEMLFNALPDADYTIRVGLTPTSAKYNISDYKLFLKLLGKFVEL